MQTTKKKIHKTLKKNKSCKQRPLLSLTETGCFLQRKLLFKKCKKQRKLKAAPSIVFRHGLQ